MNHSEDRINLAEEKIEIRESKILVWLRKFWEFSNFYGEYRASIHFKNYRGISQEKFKSDLNRAKKKIRK
jgi:hypothetical protein